MDNNLLPLFAMICTVIIVGIVQIKGMVLKREQIKADALVRIEEAKLKNQRDLELLIKQDEARASAAGGGQSHEFLQDDRSVREKLQY